ncbi:MAG: D-alanyl-D-alanine carboxypeptidase family protein [bacterium]|nr:D-alanyl-D-alanine carboxypeptidase family protein [bacterium]
MTPSLFSIILFTLLLLHVQPSYASIIPPYAPEEPETLDLPIPFYEPVLVPLNITDEAPPTTTAKAVIVLDANSATMLLEQNAATPFPPASTTKIMTALVALDRCKTDDIVTVSALDLNDENAQMGLVLGEHITVENLLYGLLLNSGNDAALNLAEHCGPGKETFIVAMNEKAKKLGLTATSFQNTTGLDATGHVMSVRDLAHLTAAALKNPLIEKIVGTIETTVRNREETRVHALKNRNQLLGRISGVIGGKTGLTEQAGECLVVAIERDGHRLIVVVFGSSDRFGDAESLIEWGFKNHRWEKENPTPSATTTLPELPEGTLENPHR